MALSFPRTDFMPALKAAQQKFWLMRRQQVSRTTGGAGIAKDLGPPIWVAEFTTTQLPHDQAMVIEALINSLEGSLQLVEIGDKRREYPLAYGGPLTGDSGLVGARDPDSSLLRVTGLAANFSASVGDYLQIVAGGVRWLHQVTEAAVANGAGTIGALSVQPRLDPVVALGDAVSFRTPCALMKLSPGSWSAEATKIRTGMSFRFEQSLE